MSDEDKDPAVHCSLCGQDIWQMSERGAFLKRTSPIGQNFVGECSPSCERKTGNQDDALLAALQENEL